MKQMIRVSLFILVLITIISGCSQPVTKAKAIVCNQPYALCSAAKCIPSPANDGTAICSCETYNGPSAGTESCNVRKPYRDQHNVFHVVSTFSFKNATKDKVLTCPNGTPWANCVDAKCTVDPTNKHRSICRCPLEYRGKVNTYGGECNTGTCKNAYWSSALASVHNFLGSALLKELPANNQPKAVMCKQS